MLFNRHKATRRFTVFHQLQLCISPFLKRGIAPDIVTLKQLFTLSDVQKQLRSSAFCLRAARQPENKVSRCPVVLTC